MNSKKEKNYLKTLLGPSKFSGQGYLGNDTREPEEIIKEDLKTLERLGIDKNKLVDALRKAYVVAERALGNPVKMLDEVSAVHHEARGRIPSPFPEDGALPKGETVITDKKSGDTFTITPLSIILIERHDFFQGKGSPFRIDPEIAGRILKSV
jgi:hypothetical protein